ncbi:MAG: 2-phospho-L-lactate guanylyltransferase [Bryobacterales bacterium]|nr:2-phospho-L-lactate guanylyltransferase [Bryobacterales bacterium]
MPGRSDIWAIIPIKDLYNGKTRLSPVLSPPERALLIEAMVDDVLSAFAEYAGMRVLIVTGDPRVAAKAEGLGMETLMEEVCQSETAAVEAATAHAIEQGAGGTLVVPADIPLLRAKDVAGIVEGAPARGTLLVPGWDGRGTNAVIRRPAGLFPLRFGNDSFLPHRAAAEATGYPLVILENDQIGLDLDSPVELRRFLTVDRVTRTRRVVDTFDLKQRLP